MRRRLAALLLLGVLGCNDDECDTCESRLGRTYEAVFTERDGNCGPLPNQVITGSASLDASCTTPDGDLSVDTEACSLSFESTCPGAAGFLVTTRGKADWNCDGTEGEVTEQFLISRESDGIVECSSTYDIELTEL